MGKRGQAKQGRIPAGRLPHGYRRGSDGKPEVDEAEGVRTLFQSYAYERLSVPVIREALRNSYGWRLSKGHVYNALALKAYAGEPLTYEGIEVPCPAIVDRETWDGAQRRRHDRLVRAPAGRPRPAYSLEGLMKCAGCGKRLLARTRRDSGTTKRYYRCSGYAHTCRQHPYINADRLEERVWREIRAVLDRPDLLSERFNDIDHGGFDGGYQGRREGHSTVDGG